MGLKNRAKQANQEGFRDPLRRTEHELVTLQEYDAYVIKDDDSGEAGPSQSNEPTSDVGPSNANAPSSEPGPSESNLDLSDLERNLPEKKVSLKELNADRILGA